MKITREKLRQIIQEELEKIMAEEQLDETEDSEETKDTKKKKKPVTPRPPKGKKRDPFDSSRYDDGSYRFDYDDSDREKDYD